MGEDLLVGRGKGGGGMKGLPIYTAIYFMCRMNVLLTYHFGMGGREDSPTPT